VAAHNRATFPVFGGISGSTRTTFTLEGWGRAGGVSMRQAGALFNATNGVFVSH
jgi:hypothetical protein